MKNDASLLAKIKILATSIKKEKSCVKFVNKQLKMITHKDRKIVMK